ncbi:M23 family metallopeptidase [Ornithinimicrobium faecis]|uniref:M23 family metallopeptidase n=1 Tax=Ornithinimicrobium faecis TaxID=2934158 RepID=A0ABY4YQB3_9MICO|nr:MULTISPECIES: M23 family metallopeptidase [unclassified Ornithinimicrobium]USQ78799.1 M23 family metallopeptidase [Ornithinimicrobium sp. HY1793]
MREVAVREPSADRPRSAGAQEPAPTPRSRREARELAQATRRRRPAPAPRHSRRRAPRSRSTTVARLSAPVLVAAVAAASIIGLPASVSAGTPTVAQTRLADAATGLPAAAAADLARQDATASRGAASRLALAQGLGAAAEGKAAMTARGQALSTSLSAGVETTAGGQDRAREVATARAFHEPILDAHQTSSFGWRWGRMHNGIDFGAGHGTPLYAVGLGTVTTAGWNSGLGYHVKITLDTGEVIVYGHLSRIDVSDGDPVAAGSQLGAVGSSGRSTGAHLHLEVRTQDGPIDPAPWLAARRG